MVYRGKPSTGCQTCRQRHIKCDETRPHCKACIRTDRACPGYLDSFDLMLRDQTASFWKSPASTSSNPSNKSSPGTNGCSPYSISSRAYSTVSIRNLVSAWPPPIGPADLYQPMEHTVIPLWFNSYLYLPQDLHIRNGFMDVLPSLYANVKSGSHLHLSTLAVGFFTLAAWTGQGSLLNQAERYFARALPKLRQALNENADSDFENLLISILLLSDYEDFMATKLWESPTKAHLRGAVALLNERKSKGLDAPVSPFLEHTVQTQIIKSSRGTTGQTVQTPQIWPLTQPIDRPTPKSLLSSITSGIVHLRSAWETMLSNPPDETQAAAILKKATEVDIDLVSWTYQLPAHWKPVAASIIPQPVRDAGIWNNRCDCYSDIWITANMNTARDCRILMHTIMLGCIHLLPSADPDESQATTIRSTIHRLADDICASIPFVLGSQLESVRMKPGNIVYPFSEIRPVTSTHIHAAPLHGAWQLFTPLRNLQNPDLGLSPEQVSWARGQMERVLTIYFQR